MDETHDGRDPTPEERRLGARVPGPFDGRWHTVLSTPLKIYDLSVGGCLIQSFHDVSPGRRMTLELQLPYEGWIKVEAETIYSRADYGFAVEFVNVPEETRVLLERVVGRLLTKSPLDE